ncbi:hypothetical protein ACWGJP_15445 [Microbacterium sp. NPDC055903]
MELGDEEFKRSAEFMDKEREKLRRVEGRRLLREARADVTAIESLVETRTPAIDESPGARWMIAPYENESTPFEIVSTNVSNPWKVLPELPLVVRIS